MCPTNSIARLPSVAKRTATQAELLRGLIGLLPNSQTSVSEFLRAVLKKTNQELIHADWGFVAVVEQNEGEEFAVVYNPARDIIATEACTADRYAGRLKVGGKELPRNKRSIVGYVAHTRRPYRCSNIADDPFYRNSNSVTLSELAVPVLFRGEVLAVVNLESKLHNFFTQSEEDFLTEVTSLIAAPLYTLMVGEGIRRAARDNDISRSVGKLLEAVPIGDTWEHSNVFDAVARAVAKSLRSRMCRIWLTGPKGSVTRRGYFAEIEDGSELWHQNFATKAIQSMCLVRGGPAYSSDGNPQLEYPHSEEGSPVSPQLATPLSVFGVPVGAISLGGRIGVGESPRPYYTEADEQLLDVVQAQLAAFAQLKRHEASRIQQSPRRSQMISQILKTLPDLDLDRVLREAVTKTPRLCQAKYCSVFLWQQDRQEFVLAASRGLPQELVGVAAYKKGEGLTGFVGEHGCALILDDRSQPSLSKVHSDLSWKAKFNESRVPPHVLQPFAAVPIFGGNGEVCGVLRLSERKRGHDYFTEADEVMLNLVASKISAAVAYSARYQERIRLLQGLNGLTDCTLALFRDFPGGDNATSKILVNACEQAREIFQADIVTIYNVRNGEIDTPPVWSGDVKEPHYMNLSLRAEDVPFSILRDKTPKYWNKAKKTPLLKNRIKRVDETRAKDRFVTREDVVAAAAVPFAVGDNVVAIGFLNFRKPSLFDHEKKSLIEAFATQAALSLEIVRLYAQVRESASREEARQLAYNLHETCTTLSLGVAHPAAQLYKLVKRDCRSLEPALKSIEQNTRDCLAELKSITGELQKEQVHTNSLEHLVRTYLIGVAPEKPEIQLKIVGRSMLAPRIEREIYLIARAMVNNAILHAEARHIFITITTEGAQTTLRVEDDGKGFDPAIQKPGSLGLRSIRHRASAIGATVLIDSSVGRGCRISIAIPSVG